ncbi:OmpA family protein [Actimicrobium antarcticum]|uniref:Porin OmpA n=1 Tax=Actimicrobium antarcticum TaxID=1051899 RepID=A0ABP7T3T1_9BURK
MKKSSKIAVALALMSCASSTVVMAQTLPDYNPSWYVAPSLNAIDPDSRFGVDKTGEGAALRFGKPVSQDWDVQFGASYARSRDNGNRYQQQLLGADALYMFSRKSFRPFVLIGAGAQRDRVNTANGGEATKTSPYINAGLGFQYGFTEQTSMQVDVRRVHGFLRGDTFNFDHSNNNYLNIGLVYAFDKPAAPVRAITPMPMPMAAPAPMPAPMPAPAPAPRFEKMTFSATELFEFDRAELRMPQTKLDQIAAALAADTQSGNNVTVSGYTDRLGSNAYNMKLSQRRADAVKAYLVNKGVPATRLNAVGNGEANPVVQCSDKKRPALIKCLEPNRRVEVEQITIEKRVN